VATLVTFSQAEESLPVGSHPDALETPHFPDRLHAFVWRNWQLVEPQRLAEVVGTSAENIVQIAESMGLPDSESVDSRMVKSGYITLVRRNWHLLPYDQLLTLLDMNCEQLAQSDLDSDDKQALHKQIQQVLDREITLAEELFAITQKDSHIGFEASNHYYYVPLDLVEKVINCEFLKQKFSK